MNFFKIKTTWTNLEIGILKMSLGSIFILLGSFFHDLIRDYYFPISIIAIVGVLYTLVLYFKKVKNVE